MKKKLKTSICLILDRSGSMSGRESDVIGGVNAFIDEQKKLDEPATLTMVRFDSTAIETFRKTKDISEVTHLTTDEYIPRGMTPLMDAIGKTIVEMDGDAKKREADKVICVIVTDGMENASREYNRETIKKMIEERQSKEKCSECGHDNQKWSFIYLGANIDSFGEAHSLGIFHGNTANYKNTSPGVSSMYSTVSDSVLMMRQTGAPVAHNLGKDIGEDEDDFGDFIDSIDVGAGDTENKQ